MSDDPTDYGPPNSGINQAIRANRAARQPLTADELRAMAKRNPDLRPYLSEKIAALEAKS